MQTGRLDIFNKNKDNIYAYVDTLVNSPLKYKNSKDEVIEETRLTKETGTLAEHLARVSTDSSLLGNVLYYACLLETSTMARAAGDIEIADKYLEKAKDVKAAWNEIFIDAKSGKTISANGEEVDTQASYATPLRYNIVSDKNLEKFVENYVETIENAQGMGMDNLPIRPYTITTGFNATGNVLNALSNNGKNETAYKLFENTEYASWLYPVTQGATSVWERWNSYTSEDGFGGNNAMNSFNHYSYGAVGDWMMAYQAGITSDPDYPGYKQFILQPTVAGEFTSLTASYESVYGTITSSWEAEDGKITKYGTTIPANTSATLFIPSEEIYDDSVEGVTYVGEQVHNGQKCQVYQLVAGTYTFN